MSPERAEAIRIVEQFPEEHIGILLQNLLYLYKMYTGREYRPTESMEATQNLQNKGSQARNLVITRKSWHIFWRIAPLKEREL